MAGPPGRRSAPFAGTKPGCRWPHELAALCGPAPRPAPTPARRRPAHGAGRHALASHIVLVAPVYWYSFPTALKTLMDHWSAWIRIPGVPFSDEMAARTFQLVTTSGDRAKAPTMIDSAELCARFFGATWGGALWNKGRPPDAVLGDAAAQQGGCYIFNSASRSLNAGWSPLTLVRTLGIDFGTSNSAAAWRVGDGRRLRLEGDHGPAHRHLLHAEDRRAHFWPRCGRAALSGADGRLMRLAQEPAGSGAAAGRRRSMAGRLPGHHRDLPKGNRGAGAANWRCARPGGAGPPVHFVDDDRRATRWHSRCCCRRLNPPACVTWALSWSQCRRV